MLEHRRNAQLKFALLMVRLQAECIIACAGIGLSISWCFAN